MSGWEDVPSTGGGGGWEDVQAKPRGFMDRANDTLEYLAAEGSFNMLPKLAAKVKELRGSGTYEENLRANERSAQQAGERIGLAGRIAAGVAGGALAGGSLADAGVTLLGRVPATAGWLTKVGAGAVEGAAYGAANEAGHSQAQDWAGVGKDAAKGAGTGALVGGTLSGAVAAAPRLITPFVNENPERARLAQVLRGVDPDGSLNLYPTAAQRTGSPALNWIENAVGKMPLGFAPRGVHTQGEAVARAAGAESGVAPMMQHGAQVPGRITQHSLTAAEDAVGSEIGRIQRAYPAQYDNQFVQELVNVANTAQSLRGEHQTSVNGFINRLLQPGAAMDPTTLQAIRTDLRLAIDPNAQPLFNHSLANMREALDNMLERTIASTGNHADIAALNNARQTYANLQTLKDAVARSGGKGSLGSVTPSSLASAMKGNMGKSSYVLGRGDLNDLARASEAILPMKEGSGTAERSALYHIIGAPLTAFTGPVASLAVNSRPAQAYLGNQLLPYQVVAPPAAVSGLLGGVEAKKRRSLLQ